MFVFTLKEVKLFILQEQYQNSSQTLSQLRTAILTLPAQLAKLDIEVANALVLITTANRTVHDIADLVVSKRDEMAASVTTAQLTKFNSTKALNSAKNAQGAAVTYMVSLHSFSVEYQVSFKIQQSPWMVHCTSRASH